jgi:hypothetical protein
LVDSIYPSLSGAIHSDYPRLGLLRAGRTVRAPVPMLGTMVQGVTTLDNVAVFDAQ